MAVGNTHHSQIRYVVSRAGASPVTARWCRWGALGECGEARVGAGVVTTRRVVAGRVLGLEVADQLRHAGIFAGVDGLIDNEPGLAAGQSEAVVDAQKVDRDVERLVIHFEADLVGHGFKDA